MWTTKIVNSTQKWNLFLLWSFDSRIAMWTPEKEVTEWEKWWRRNPSTGNSTHRLQLRDAYGLGDQNAYEGQNGLLYITILTFYCLDPPITVIDDLDQGHGKERVMHCGRRPLSQSYNNILYAKWLVNFFIVDERAIVKQISMKVAILPCKCKIIPLKHEEM